MIVAVAVVSAAVTIGRLYLAIHREPAPEWTNPHRLKCWSGGVVVIDERVVVPNKPVYPSNTYWTEIGHKAIRVEGMECIRETIP